MEVCFELLIPQVDFETGFPFIEEKVLWGDDKFSQEPKQFSWKEHITLTERPIPEHIFNYIPEDVDVSNWVFLSLNGSALEDWEKHINYQDAMPQVLLKELLIQLLPKLDAWIVVFELNCDQIDYVCQIEPNDLIDKIDLILDWSNEPEGFVAWNRTP